MVLRQNKNDFLSNISYKEDKFRDKVVSWGASNIRSYPWRNTSDPYKIYVAETLLKRTTATAVAKVYTRFLESFPDLVSLKKSNEEKIKEILKPLGLYRQRSRGIKSGVKFIFENYNGEFPNLYNDLINIPYVGEYTARAILSFSFNEPFAILDSNVRRVVTRCFYNELSEKEDDKNILNYLDKLIPKDNHKVFNWALLDLGFLICSYGDRIKCNECPLWCICDFKMR